VASGKTLLPSCSPPRWTNRTFVSRYGDFWAFSVRGRPGLWNRIWANASGNTEQRFIRAAAGQGEAKKGGEVAHTRVYGVITNLFSGHRSNCKGRSAASAPGADAFEVWSVTADCAGDRSCPLAMSLTLSGTRDLDEHGSWA